MHSAAPLHGAHGTPAGRLADSYRRHQRRQCRHHRRGSPRCNHRQAQRSHRGTPRRRDFAQTALALFIAAPAQSASAVTEQNSLSSRIRTAPLDTHQAVGHPYYILSDHMSQNHKRRFGSLRDNRLENCMEYLNTDSTDKSVLEHSLRQLCSRLHCTRGRVWRIRTEKDGTRVCGSTSVVFSYEQ